MYTVLIIDDSPSMRRIIKDMINSIEEFEVVCVATDAYDAREKIKEYEPDLVTIDINMPKNGWCYIFKKFNEITSNASSRNIRRKRKRK